MNNLKAMIQKLSVGQGTIIVAASTSLAEALHDAQPSVVFSGLRKGMLLDTVHKGMAFTGVNCAINGVTTVNTA